MSQGTTIRMRRTISLGIGHLWLDEPFDMHTVHSGSPIIMAVHRHRLRLSEPTFNLDYTFA